MLKATFFNRLNVNALKKTQRYTKKKLKIKNFLNQETLQDG